MMNAFGAIDIVVCAAGITKEVPTFEMADDDWQRIMDTNVTGVLRSGRVFGRERIARRRGRMITIASLASYTASLVMAQVLAVDGGFVASGVNR